MEPILVKKKLDDSQEFKVSRFKKMIKKTRPHKHEGYYELIFIAAGEGFHWVDSTRHPIQAPDLYFLKPGQLHCWQFTSIPDGFVMMFREEFLDPISEGRLVSIVRQMGDFNRVQAMEDPAIGWIFEEVLSLYPASDAYSKDVVKGYLRVLFAKLLDKLSADGAGLPEASPLYDRFLSLLNQETPILHKVSDYADRLNVSHQSLNRVCKKRAGCTASELIGHQLVLEAKRQILHSEHNMSGIADLLGFNDASYFIKFFRKNAGETPHQFRVRHLGGESRPDYE